MIMIHGGGDGGVGQGYPPQIEFPTRPSRSRDKQSVLYGDAHGQLISGKRAGWFDADCRSSRIDKIGVLSKRWGWYRKRIGAGLWLL
jgi:hypothetical protein